jgi:RimJ/RimL family protein N-acetyltransferase
MERAVDRADDLVAPTVNILGERVALGPLRRELLPQYGRWFNDFHVSRTYGAYPGPHTAEDVARWYEGHAASEPSILFTVYRREGWRPIGFAGLDPVNLRHPGTAIFTILIGERAEQGKGYGTESTRLVLDYAFTALGLHNVMLRVDEFNVAGIRAYRKAGFREFGRRRQVLWLDGRLWDSIYMDCLAHEFTSPVLGRILVPDQPRSGSD